MDHLITSYDQIEVGDVLSMRNNYETNNSPHYNRRSLKMNVRVPVHDYHNARPNPDYVRGDPELSIGMEMRVRLNTNDIQVVALTDEHIMLDLVAWRWVDERDEHMQLGWCRNVIMDKSYFTQTWLQNSSVWSCYFAGNVHGNPTPLAIPDEEDRNPPTRIRQAASMAQANPYTIANMKNWQVGSSILGPR